MFKELEEITQDGDWSVAFCFILIFPRFQDGKNLSLVPYFRQLGECYLVVEQQKKPLSSSRSKVFDLFCADIIKASGFASLQAVMSVNVYMNVWMSKCIFLKKREDVSCHAPHFKQGDNMNHLLFEGLK